ncbi:hypothetical protein BWD09_05810 [Neisseria dentiae]|uniref:Uncharacterized protein n=1 Tax=Neisseria dentiae TaxID=194197 RepID=A0A1X3DBQ4_9NEIS|nr:hypothetical protein BWD09_05810 [Neisseria dentiae]
MIFAKAAGCFQFDDKIPGSSPGITKLDVSDGLNKFCKGIGPIECYNGFGVYKNQAETFAKLF